MSLIPSGVQRSVALAQRHARFFGRHNTPLKMANLLSLYLQKWANRSALTAYPFEIIIEPTNICNLHCPLCPTGQGTATRPPGRMRLETFRGIIDRLGRYLYKVRIYNWGEPLLHPDIFRMIAYATASNVSTEISSHMNVFTEEHAKAMIASGLELLVVSLDGADAETYSRYRVGGDFDAVVRNVALLTEAKRKAGSRYPIVEVQFLAMRHNEGQVREMGRLAARLGADSLRVGPVTLNIRNAEDLSWLPSEEALSRYYYNEKVDRIYSTRKKCEWLWRSIVVNWDGTAAPCCVYEGRKAELGSILENDFLTVWNSPAYRRSREVFTGGGNKSQGGPRTICSYCRGVPTALNDRQHGLY